MWTANKTVVVCLFCFECNFIHRRYNENLVKLRRKVKVSIKYKPDLEGNVVNWAIYSFSKSEYKLFNKSLNFIPTLNVYNENKVDNDLNNFFKLIKLKGHFKGSINKDTGD